MILGLHWEKSNRTNQETRLLQKRSVPLGLLQLWLQRSDSWLTSEAGCVGSGCSDLWSTPEAGCMGGGSRSNQIR